MSIAAFFRDKRVQTAMSGPRSDQAALLVEEFVTRFKTADCSPDQLLALSDLAVRSGNAALAAEALQLVLDGGAKVHLARYRMGRLLMTQSKPAEAAVQFSLGAEADAGFAHNAMGAARALYGQGLKAEAANWAERFVAFNTRPHHVDDLALLGDLADFLFDSGQRARALPIYELITSFGAERSRHVVRLAEARIANGDFVGAASMLLDQTAKSGPDPWSNRALALCYSHQGDHAAAISRALQAVQANPADQGFVGTYVRVLGKSGNPTAINAALAQHAAWFTPADVTELTTRRRLTEGDLQGAAANLLAATVVADSRLYYLSVEVAYAALTASRIDTAESLAAMLDGVAPEAVATKILRIDICFRQLQWEDAGIILASLPVDETERPQIVMKRLEYACFVGDWEGAAVAAARLEVLAQAGRHFLVPVFRYLAERQDWHGVMARALPWLDASLNYGQIGYVLFRAAKHTGRQAELRAAIEGIADWAAHAGLLSLRNNIAYDMVAGLADIDALLNDPATAGNAGLREKLLLRRDVLAIATGAVQRRAVFLCADANFLCATMVALHGLAAAIDHRRVDFYIVAEDDVLALAGEAARRFVDAGVSVTVVAASEVIGSAHRLFATYGLFTSGHKLASAAYYRIYFARYLERLGVHDRALYVDSDIVLATRLDHLLDLHLDGRPMAARLETARPEVRRAITHHRLADGRYFNSGVLLFDLKHAELAAALEGAVAAIADETVTLLYHDQCALNLGFRENFADLDMAFNYPVTEITKLGEIPDGTALLHFLDRPKPWSAAYGGSAASLWFEKWRGAAEFLGEKLAVALFAEIRD